MIRAGTSETDKLSAILEVGTFRISNVSFTSEILGTSEQICLLLYLSVVETGQFVVSSAGDRGARYWLFKVSILAMKELVQEEAPDSGYGCCVANRFGQLFDDESDPYDILHQVQVEKPKPRKKDDSKKGVGKAVKKGSQRDRMVVLPVAGDGEQGSNVSVKTLPGKLTLTM